MSTFLFSLLCFKCFGCWNWCGNDSFFFYIWASVKEFKCVAKLQKQKRTKGEEEKSKRKRAKGINKKSALESLLSLAFCDVLCALNLEVSNLENYAHECLSLMLIQWLYASIAHDLDGTRSKHSILVLFWFL